MKNLNSFLVFACLLFIHSCSQEFEEMGRNQPPKESTQSTEIGYPNCEGHTGSADPMSADSRQFIYTDFQKITACEANDLKYIIHDNCMGTVYEDVIAEAVGIYNGLGTSLHFTPTTNYEDAHLFFTCPTGFRCGAGAAFAPVSTGNDPPIFAPARQTEFPSGGTIGSQVSLYTNWSHCDCDEEDNCNFTFNGTNDCMFLRVALHEIGHTLGIAHNDGIGLPTTMVGSGPTYQANSIFNNGNDVLDNCDFCDNASCAFNANDIDVIEHLYPPLPQILPNPPDIVVYFDPCFHLIHLYDMANPNVKGLHYEWFVTGLINKPHVNQKNPGYARVSYKPGERVYISLKVTGPCGDSVFADDLCFITPPCKGDGAWVPGVPCDSEPEPECVSPGDCPNGYNCVNGECVEIVVGPDCQNNSHCPSGYACINGNCVNMDGYDCLLNSHCPSGFYCKNGFCAPI